MPPAATTACLDENAVLALLDGRLSAVARATAEAHLLECRACMALLALAERDARETLGPPAPPRAEAPAGAPARGSSIGRYTILDRVGSGGMGEVFAAYDPELDRRVALKLLHEGSDKPGSRGQASARLLREAKAIARLSHPNVVVVHDAGAIDGRVFIAMEFVRGTTLWAWLQATPRSWSEIRAVFLAAGRGLQAAHAAGLVHRDVKPQNIMVSDDGTVRVTDFGLASDPLADKSAAVGSDAVQEPATDTVALTRTGMFLGTPLYMAPEQFRGEKADARTDQFSFCVSLYEAVYGQKPFAGKSFAELRDAVLAGKPSEPPDKGRAPAWVRRIIWRGLSPRPADRFPSMDALLAALERDPGRTRRRLAVGALVALALVVAGAVAQRSMGGGRAAPLCAGATDKLRPLWEWPADGRPAPRRTAIQRAFMATDRSYAAATWEKATVILDGFAQRWSTMFRESCQATYLQGQQSQQVLDLRTDCLNSALEGLQAVTDLFTRADGEVVAGASKVLGGLPDLSRCADTRLLRAVVRPPTDAAQRAQVDALWRRAAAMRALNNAGKLVEVMRDIDALVADARAVGYAPIYAEALSVLGNARGFTGDMDKALQALNRGLPVAVAAHDDQKAGEIAALIAGLLAGSIETAEQADNASDLADGFLNRVGGSGDLARAWTAHARGQIRITQGRIPEALALLREAIARKGQIEGQDNPDVAISYTSLGSALIESGDLQGALDANLHAVSILQNAAGQDTPLLGLVLNNLGEIYNQLSRPADAVATFQRCLAVWSPVVAADSPWLAYPLTGLGLAYLQQKKPGDARPLLERALAVREATDPTAVRLGETRFALAQAVWGTGDDGARARALASAAQHNYASVTTPLAKAKLAEVEAWLREHPASAAGRLSKPNAGPGGRRGTARPDRPSSRAGRESQSDR